MDVDESELHDLYLWVDDIPLSRPKRNIARDFSDGVLVAEVVKNFQPRLVELHNYSPANGLAQKLYNWSTLNQKVFRRLGFVLRHPECEAVAACAPGAIERVLKLLRIRLAEFEAQHPQDADRSQPGSPRASGTQTAADDAEDDAAPAAGLPWGEQAALLRIEEQECTIADLRAANEALEERVAQLTAALQQRDDRLAALDDRLQDLMSKGMRNCNIIRPARPLAERTPNQMPQAAAKQPLDRAAVGAQRLAY